MSKKLSAVLAALAVVAVPAAVAQAHPGRGADRPAPRAERPHAPKKLVKPVAYVARGTVKAVDATAKTITITVADRDGATNRHARAWRGTDVTFDVSSARLQVRDVNGDGVRDLADVAVGDLAGVHARLPRLLDGVAMPYAAKQVRARKAPATTSTDATEPGAPAPAASEPAAA